MPAGPAGGLPDLLPGSLAPGVGLVRQLVHIVADGRQFPQQGGVFVRWAGPQVYAQDQLTEQRLHFQPRGLRLLPQVGVFGGVQPQGDGLIWFHRTASRFFLGWALGSRIGAVFPGSPLQ